jgi:hypothetical protein
MGVKRGHGLRFAPIFPLYAGSVYPNVQDPPGIAGLKAMVAPSGSEKPLGGEIWANWALPPFVVRR